MAEPTLMLNRERRALLDDVQAGRVYRSMGGCDLRQVRRGQNQRVDRKLRELVQAGWVALDTDGRTYMLTGTAPRGQS